MAIIGIVHAKADDTIAQICPVIVGASNPRPMSFLAGRCKDQTAPEHTPPSQAFAHSSSSQCFVQATKTVYPFEFAAGPYSWGTEPGRDPREPARVRPGQGEARQPVR